MRVSTARQAEEGQSLPAQERAITTHAAAKGWQLGEVYSDVMTGGRGDRPGLQEALAAAERGEYSVLVTPKLDRLGRSQRHNLEIFDRLEVAGVALVALDAPFDATTAAGKLSRGVLSLMAEFERNRIRERTRDGMAEQAHRGHPHWSTPPYGYRRDADGCPAVQEEQAAVVRRIWRAYAAGATQPQIAKGLRADGIKSPAGRAWGQGGIHRLLANVTYGGRRPHKGAAIATDVIPRIVDEGTYTAVQARLAANKRHGGARGPKGKRHLFVTPLPLYCGRCSPDADLDPTSAVRMYTHTDGKGGAYYMCSSRRPHSPEACPTIIPRGPYDRAVIDYAMRAVIDLGATRRDSRMQLQGRAGEVRKQRMGFERQAMEAQAAIDRADADYAAGELKDAANYERLVRKYTEQQGAATAAAARLRAHEEALAAADAPDADDELLRHLAAVKRADSVEAVRAALVGVFNGFVLHQLGPEHAGYGAEVGLAVGAYWLQPLPAPGAVTDWDASLWPLYRRVPLPLNQAAGEHLPSTPLG